MSKIVVKQTPPTGQTCPKADMMIMVQLEPYGSTVDVDQPRPGADKNTKTHLFSSNYSVKKTQL